MAIIYSYPQYAPKPEDLLIGTVTLDENAAVPIYDNPTVSFTIQSLLDMIAPITGAQNLQQVTNIGATTTNSVVFSNNISVSGKFNDSSNGSGSLGQVLSSTVTGTSWINNVPGGVTSIETTSPIEGGTITSQGTITHKAVLTDAGGTAGSYTNTDITVDGNGHITSITNGTPGGVISVGAYGKTPATSQKYTGLRADTTAGIVTIGLDIVNMTSIGASIANEDLMIVTDDVAGTPYNKKITALDLKNYVAQTILGVGTDSTNAGIILSNNGGTVLILGDGSVSSNRSGNTITLTGSYGSWTASDDASTPITGPIINGKTLQFASTGSTETALTNDGAGNYVITIPDTQNPFQTIDGTGTANGSTGVILSDSGGTVILNGTNSITVTRDAATSKTLVISGIANAVTVAGYVAAPAATDANLVWKTDASGNPDWRTDADTGITSVVVNTGADETEPLAKSITGRQLTLTSNVFGGGAKVGYVPVNTDGTQFLRGDGNWASIPTGLNYQGVWAASTTAEVATQSGTNLTIVTADASLIVGTIVEGTGISGTVKIATVTDSSTFVLDTSVTVSVGTILTMSAPGGAPVLTGTGLQGDGILYICTVAGKAYPNNFRSTTPIATPGDWNVGDWCVFTGTAGAGEWTRIPATNAGVTSATTTDGSFIEYSPVLSGSAGAITIGADLSAGGTASGTTFLRGDNQWAVPGGTGVTSITGQEPITIVTTGGPTATTPRVDLRYVDTGGNTPIGDNVVTVALSAGTDTLDNDDTLIINDKVDTRTTPLYNTVKKFTLQSLKNFVGAGNITAVNTTLGLTGGGAGPGALTLSANYETDANIVKASNFNNSSPTTVTGGSTSQNQITISAAAAENIKVGMIAGTSALSNNIGTVSVNNLTGLITFANNLGVTVGTGDTVYFSSVLTTASELMFSTGANTDTFVTTLPLSRIDLNLFDTTNLPSNTVFTPAVLNPLTIGIKGQVPAPPTITASNPTGYFLRSNATWGHAISSLLTGDGLKGGPISQSGTVSVEYSGELIFNTPLDNVITSANSLIIPGGDYIDTTDLILISDTTNSISATSNGAVTAGAAVTLTVDPYTPTGINIEAGLNIYDASGINAYYGVVTAASNRLYFTCNLDTDIADGVALIFRNNTEVKKALVSQLPFVPSSTSFISTVTADNGLKIGGTASNPIVEASYTKAEFEVNGAAATNQKTFTLTIALTGIDGATVKNIAGQTIGVVDSVSSFTVTCVANLAYAVADGEMLTFSTKPKNLITAAPPDALGILAADEMLVLSAASGLVERKPIGDLPSPAASSNYYLNAIARTASTNTIVFTVKDRPGTAPSFTFGANAFNSTTIPSANTVMGAGNSYAAGLVLAGSATHGDSFLRKDGSWQTPGTGPNDNTTYTIDVPAATTNINLKGADPSSNDAIALTPSTGITITRNNDSQLTFENSGVVELNMPNTGPGEGGILLSANAGTIDIGIDYIGGNNIISTAWDGTGSTVPTAAHILWADTANATPALRKVFYSSVSDLPFAPSSASGTVTSISALNAGVLVSASTTTPTVGVNYGAAGAGGTNLILVATDKTGVAPQGSDQILVSDTVNSVLERYEIDDLPFTNNAGTVTRVRGTGTKSGLTLTGDVTSDGYLTLGGTLSLTSANVTDGLGFTPYNNTNPSGFTNNTGTVTSVGTGSGLTGGAITTSGTISVDYSVATDNIILGADDQETVDIPTNARIMYADSTNAVRYAFVADLPFTNTSGDIDGVTAGVALEGGGTSGTVTLNVRYAGTSSVIFSATDATGTDIDSNDVILYTDSAGATVNYGSVSDLPFENGTVTSVGGTGTVSGLTLTGTVTTSGNLTLGGTLSLTSANVTDGLGYTPLESETDTLANVTGRGATTATACSFTSTSAQVFGSSGTGDVFLGNNGSNKFIRFHTNNVNTYFDMACGDVIWRQGSAGGGERFEQNMTSGTFTAKGDVVAFGSPSDKRLKENIKPIESALDKVSKLQGVTFDWKKSDSILDIKEDIGFIAQDVQKVAPELVRENEDGMLSMRHQGIAPILLEAIKELKAEIEELKLNKCNCNK